MGVPTLAQTYSIKMKFLVLATCIAVSSAQLVSYPNGAVVPADEPAVAAVRASHLAAHGNILPHAGLPYAAGYPYAAGHAYAAGYPYAAGHAYAAGYAGYPYAAGYVHQPFVAHPNGAVVPADEPAVVAARADHLAAHGAAYAAGYPYAAGYAGYPYAAGYVNQPLVAHPNGAVVPADEPAVVPAEPLEVVAARAEHLAAHGIAY